SAEQVALTLARIEFELRAAMFGIGAPALTALRGTPYLIDRAADI
ncbi:MAG: hypothetical protein K0Q59_490, partial [Paenibacillus sp.]|nr:hypothetical protein [Paenibacillus sp.]